MLIKIFGYLEAAENRVLYQWIVDDEPLRVVCFADADDGSCPLTAWTTTGACAFLTSPSGTMAPVSWCARRQTCAAASTGEAEVVALGEAFHKMLAPMASLMSQVQRCDEDLCALGSDSTTALIAVDKGITPGMKYLRKNQRIPIASLTDGVSESGTMMMKVDSETNVADRFTNRTTALEDRGVAAPRCIQEVRRRKQPLSLSAWPHPSLLVRRRQGVPLWRPVPLREACVFLADTVIRASMTLGPALVSCVPTRH